VGEAHVAGDGYEPEQPHSIAMHPFQPGLGDRLQLHARETGRPDILLDIIHQYTIVYTPNDSGDGPYWARSSLYRYQVYDLERRELLLYHWHPDGLSSVTAPHLHAACALYNRHSERSEEPPREAHPPKVDLPMSADADRLRRGILRIRSG
jgi:hypothetical protein